MPYGIVLKDERRTSNIERPTSNEKRISNTEHSTAISVSSCLLNAFANQVHIERWGFHPYAWEIAGIVRSGGLSREEGLAKVSEPPNPVLVSRVRERLGLS
jgi:hypothetical protein